MSADSTRTELLKVLAELSELYPDWRLGQMMANLALFAGHAEAGAVWDLEDSEALAAARKHIERRSEQLAVQA